MKITFRGITYANYQMNTRTRCTVGEEGSRGMGGMAGGESLLLGELLTWTDACLDGLNALITSREKMEKGSGAKGADGG